MLSSSFIFECCKCCRDAYTKRVIDPPFRRWLHPKDRGLLLDKREYGTLLKGLVGRVRDVDDGVVDAAVDALCQMYHAGPDRRVQGVPGKSVQAKMSCA